VTLFQAEDIAVELLAALAPYCERRAIAGSVRRRRPEVGDIELVVIPKIARVQTGLFENDMEEYFPLNSFIFSNPDFALRPNKNGQTAFGDKNKLLLYKGCPFDIFTATHDNWTMVYFIRTGGQENNVMIATRAQKLGYALEIYGGFRSKLTNTLFKMQSEEQIYEFLELDYVRPEDRK
jgi:DNA polymerase/3'-5' exonuclease PolX